MNITKAYTFNYRDYNKDGFNIHNGLLFSEYIQNCEIDFFESNGVYYADHFFANDLTMLLLKRCHNAEKNEDYGMELINGEVDMDTNLEIEEYSDRVTIYAINTQRDLDEPLWLVIDDSMKDGIFELKYIPEDDENDEKENIKDPVIPEKFNIFA